MNLKEIIIAVEDHRFYDHCGLDFIAIARAIFMNLRTGRKSQGGSTITQQLARTLYLSPKKSYLRKLKEAWIALKLERGFTKDEILDMYVKMVYMGKATGFYIAANHYFNLDVDELNLRQRVALVAMLRGPNLYQPKSEAGIKRQMFILSKLLYADQITLDEFNDSVCPEALQP